MVLTFDKENHKYFYAGYPVPGLNEILESMGLCDFSNVPPGLLEYKTAIGDAVHLALDLDSAGILDEESLDDQTLPRVEAYRKFAKDHQFVTEWSERQLFSERGYAGTGDRGGKMNGLSAYVDIKTGCKYRENRLKTAGYNAILQYAVRGCVYLFEDGTYEWDEHEDDEDYDIWIFLVRAFHWKKPRYSKGKKWAY